VDQVYVYKDVEIPRKLLGIINHMEDVESYREELHNLGNQWDLLTILGQMGGTGTDMTGTRAGFSRLTSELLAQLALETLKKTVQDMGAKAQVAVDIVIRNLFERTADIGFLVTTSATFSNPVSSPGMISPRITFRIKRKRITPQFFRTGCTVRNRLIW